MPSATEIKWLAEPEDQDYPAAVSYLSLIYEDPWPTRYVEHLHEARISKFKGKEILRASGLPLLGVSNSHVEKDRAKILAGESLSPLLLLRASGQNAVLIADGYHRLCAVYALDEDSLIPCKII